LSSATVSPLDSGFRERRLSRSDSKSVCRRERGSGAGVNAWISGDTTAGGLARVDRALAEKPDVVILELGTNDALRGI
jgi:lysophospholipase L1-like esterase